MLVAVLTCSIHRHAPHPIRQPLLRRFSIPGHFPPTQTLSRRTLAVDPQCRAVLLLEQSIIEIYRGRPS